MVSLREIKSASFKKMENLIYFFLGKKPRIVPESQWKKKRTINCEGGIFFLPFLPPHQRPLLRRIGIGLFTAFSRGRDLASNSPRRNLAFIGTIYICVCVFSFSLPASPRNDRPKFVARTNSYNEGDANEPTPPPPLRSLVSVSTRTF